MSCPHLNYHACSCDFPDEVEDALKAVYLQVRLMSIEFTNKTGDECDGLNDALSAIEDQLARRVGKNAAHSWIASIS